MYTKELTLNVNKFTIGWAEYLEKKVALLKKDGENWQMPWLQKPKNLKNKTSNFMIKTMDKQDSHLGLLYSIIFSAAIFFLIV